MNTKYSFPSKRQWRPTGLWDVEDLKRVVIFCVIIWYTRTSFVLLILNLMEGWRGGIYIYMTFDPPPLPSAPMKTVSKIHCQRNLTCKARHRNTTAFSVRVIKDLVNKTKWMMLNTARTLSADKCRGTQKAQQTAECSRCVKSSSFVALSHPVNCSLRRFLYSQPSPFAGSHPPGYFPLLSSWALKIRAPAN
jgi:hypothetical protein